MVAPRKARAAPPPTIPKARTEEKILKRSYCCINTSFTSYTFVVTLSHHLHLSLSFNRDQRTGQVGVDWGLQISWLLSRLVSTVWSVDGEQPFPIFRVITVDAVNLRERAI